MYIVECLPLIRSLNKESLSYFSSQNIEIGTLVKIEVRKQKVFALVLGCIKASERKLDIKSADFQFKKIISISSKFFVDKDFLQGIKDTADFFGTSGGAVFNCVVPTLVLKTSDLLTLGKNKKKINNRKFDFDAIQAEDEERFSYYKTIIRENFAQKKSVYVCLPQNENAKLIYNVLSKGIESYCFLFHNTFDEKEIIELWKKILESKHPVLIVATANFLSIPRYDLGTIIIENENNDGWKTFVRPFIDYKILLENISKHRGLKLIFGDLALSVETIFKYKEFRLESENLKWRISVPISSISIEKDNKDKESYILSKECRVEINKTLEKNGNVFIYSSRKGLGSFVLCEDCKTLVSCNNCSSTMVLHGRNKNIFVCHQCGEVRTSEEVCKNCGGWRLMTFGVGVEKIREEIERFFPNLSNNNKIFEIDSDLANTSIKAKKIIDKFLEEDGSVLVGTEMALNYLHKKIDTTVIVSLDSLFAIPNYKIREKIFKLILDMQNLANKKFILQNRNSKDELTHFALNGNLSDFYRSEIKDREILGYPPFFIFIKLTVRGSKSFVEKEITKLERITEKWEPTSFNSLHEKKGEINATNLVIKIDRKKWPDIDLLSTLRSLPPYIEIKVNPTNLL